MHGHNECKQHLKMKADAAREEYRQRRELGLCVRCPKDDIKDALPGQVTCKKHASYLLRKVLEYKRAKKAKEAKCRNKK